MLFDISHQETKYEQGYNEGYHCTDQQAASSIPVNANPNFNTFRRLAPNITGIARKKVNSAATVLDIPIIIAPRIVAPERDVPGSAAATSWQKPMINASL